MGKDKEKNAALKQAYKLKMKSKAKERKQNLKEKRAKLVVKNLPFSATEENLKAYFGKFGTVTNIHLLKKDDGMLTGCGFVQFDAVQKAAKAKHHLNGKEFMGRALECDFAMPKKQFDKKVYNEKRKQFWLDQKIKEEPIDVDTVAEKPTVDENVIDCNEIKTEPDENIDEAVVKEADSSSDDSSEEEKEPKEENDESSSEGEEEKGPKEESHESSSENDEEDDADSMIDQKDEEIDSGLDEDEKLSQTTVKKQKYESHDVSEGRTVFVKNLPFEATNSDLKECMKQFGPLYYALVCVDKMTEHSKGTAFVKFRNKEDADKCLKAGTELTCLGTILDCHPAVGRQDIQNKSKEKEKQKDSRNLYLIKEGVVLAGTKAAEGVSAADMAKRLQLEQYKTQMLRNLNMFIARTRLIIHNLPPTWDDNKLRILLKKHAGPGAVIRECRVMRNLKNVDAKGVGSSKEHGFVSFTTHEHALNALRSLNNNPHVFSASKRPIVAFSIENRVMVNTKQKRLEKSRQLNPLARQFDAGAKKDHQSFKKRKREEDGDARKRRPQIIEGDKFAGTQAKPGQINKMRSRYKLNTQAQLHYEQVKAEKKQKKNVHKTLQQKKEEFTRQDGQKINKQKRDRDIKDDSFAKMVNAYKNKLLKTGSSNQSNKLQTRGAWTDG